MQVQFPDRTVRQLNGPALPKDLLTDWNPAEAKKAVACLVNGELADLLTPVDGEVVLQPLAAGEGRSLEVLRHSAAHLMASAVVELFPQVKVAIGPAIADGFYYDFEYAPGFTPQDLEAIEKKMRQIAAADHPFVRRELPKAEARRLMAERSERYKLEILDELPGDTVALYGHGSFLDLCRGPHLPRTGLIRAFKLLTISGAYWRGDEKRAQLQRIYGTAFFQAAELDEHLRRLEEAKNRDHRKLGRELDLFSINDTVGAGLVLWHPKGGMIRYLMEEFWRQEHLKNGYEMVFTPHLARLHLWETSGHTEFYRENMFPTMDLENQAYQVKPMNCPFHIQIYQSQTRSYRDLPFRWAELGTVYRFERSGVLHGLLRVRGFTQDDAHHFFRQDQAQEEITRTIRFSVQMLRAFGFHDFQIYLSTRPAKRVGSDAMWDMAETALRKGLEEVELAYEVDPGEGVFYGPKIDIKLRDSLKRTWQCSTIQFDFNLPQRFQLEYVDRDGSRRQPFMLHRALLGSLERFLGCLIEHYGGAFPLWLAPEQVRLISISEEQEAYVQGLREKMAAAGLRCGLDLSNEKLGYKVRQGQLAKIPYLVICGRKEAAEGKVSLRSRKGEQQEGLTAEQVIEKLKQEERERL